MALALPAYVDASEKQEITRLATTDATAQQGPAKQSRQGRQEGAQAEENLLHQCCPASGARRSGRRRPQTEPAWHHMHGLLCSGGWRQCRHSARATLDSGTIWAQILAHPAALIHGPENGPGNRPTIWPRPAAKA